MGKLRIEKWLSVWLVKRTTTHGPVFYGSNIGTFESAVAIARSLILDSA